MAGNGGGKPGSLFGPDPIHRGTLMAYDDPEATGNTSNTSTWDFFGIIITAMLAFMGAAICVACVCGSVVIIKNTVDYVHTHQSKP